VSLVHIGVLYLITTDATSALGSEEVVNEGFYPLSRAGEMIDDPDKTFEEWTRIVIEYLMEVE